MCDMRHLATSIHNICQKSHDEYHILCLDRKEKQRHLHIGKGHSKSHQYPIDSTGGSEHTSTLTVQKKVYDSIDDPSPDTSSKIKQQEFLITPIAL